MTLVVAVGLRGDYLLVSIGSSTDVLARLGQGKHLAERPELAPLQKFAGKRLTGVDYLSKAMSVRIASNKENIDELLKTADALLPLANLPAGEQEQIRKDAAELAADLKQVFPEPGAMMGLGFLTDRGLETYQYTWGEQPDAGRLQAAQSLAARRRQSGHRGRQSRQGLRGELRPVREVGGRGISLLR